MVKIFCGCDSLSVLFVGQSVPSSEVMFNRKLWQWMRPSGKSHVDRAWNIFAWGIFLLRWDGGKIIAFLWEKVLFIVHILWGVGWGGLAFSVIESALSNIYSYFFFSFWMNTQVNSHRLVQGGVLCSRGQIAGLYFKENKHHQNISLQTAWFWEVSMWWVRFLLTRLGYFPHICLAPLYQDIHLLHF